MILVSACLAGVNTRHDGTNKMNEGIRRLVAARKAIPLCPEVLGGMGIPRPVVEISGGTGQDVLSGKALVKDREGKDHTPEVLNGVKEFLKAATRLGIKTVILKSNSPTCGAGKIYDGTFTGKLMEGDGVLTAELEKEGIKVYTEENCGEFIKNL